MLTQPSMVDQTPSPPPKEIPAPTEPKDSPPPRELPPEHEPSPDTPTPTKEPIKTFPQGEPDRPIR